LRNVAGKQDEPWTRLPTRRRSASVLRAIETEDYDQLPGGIFNTSYIRQYATAAGLDEEELLSRYHAKVARRTDGRPTPKSPARQRRGPAPSAFSSR
jgi:cytoskeletal protein RodZ